MHGFHERVCGYQCTIARPNQCGQVPLQAPGYDCNSSLVTALRYSCVNPACMLAMHTAASAFTFLLSTSRLGLKALSQRFTDGDTWTCFLWQYVYTYIHSCVQHLSVTAHVQKKMRDIEAQVRQLLPLLTVSLASSGGIEAALDDLLRRIVSLQGECAESSYHLRQVATTVDGLSHCGATRTDVQQTLTTLHGTMRDLHGDITRRVLDGFAAIHVQLDAAAAKILHEVGDLNSSSPVLHVVLETVKEVQRGQGQMAANQDELMQCMQEMLSQLQHLQDQFLDSPASQLARQAGSGQVSLPPTPQFALNNAVQCLDDSPHFAAAVVRLAAAAAAAQPQTLVDRVHARGHCSPCSAS